MVAWLPAFLSVACPLSAWLNGRRLITYICDRLFRLSVSLVTCMPVCNLLFLSAYPFAFIHFFSISFLPWLYSLTCCSFCSSIFLSSVGSYKKIIQHDSNRQIFLSPLLALIAVSTQRRYLHFRLTVIELRTRQQTCIFIVILVQRSSLWKFISITLRDGQRTAKVKKLLTPL